MTEGWCGLILVRHVENAHFLSRVFFAFVTGDVCLKMYGKNLKRHKSLMGHLCIFLSQHVR